MIVNEASGSTRIEPRGRARPSAAVGAAAVGYLLFVVYGSLVPLDYHPMPLAVAWRSFLHTGYLDLGVGARADWVANILLYMPLAYLGCEFLAGNARSTLARAAAAVVVLAGCVGVAIAVEFTQLYFPPRTVSLNDLVAEAIGSVLGIVAWLAWGRAVAALWAEMGRGGLPAIRAAFVLYVLAYVALSLFPFDFLVSARELADKLAGDGYALVATADTCGKLTPCVGKLLGETVAVVPLGVLLGMALPRSTRHPYRIAAAAGAALGLGVEIGQLFLASGISDGVSVATRAAGFAVGVAIQRHVDLRAVDAARAYVVPALALLAAPYALALAWANGWFSAHWVGVAEARAGLGEVRWLPFYYHYYTTETQALKSLLAMFAMYAPVGLAYWAWTLRPRRPGGGASALAPALVAAAAALVAEAGKLFVPGRHPDPTDVLIAMVAAALGYAVAARLHGWALQGAPAATPPAAAAAPPGGGAIAAGGVGPALLLSAGAVLALVNHPLRGVPLSAAFAAYAAVLWLRPGLALPAVLAALPLLDFSPWSGWILVSEFDVMVAVTLAVWLLRRRGEGPKLPAPPGSALIVGLVAVSFFTSAVVGLLPPSGFDANALGSYYTGYNSLRALKGFAWALALVPIVIDAWRDAPRMQARWCAGMLAGLAAVVAVVVWQRIVFASLTDFTVVYRVEGPFPELHTGGGDVHAYLVMAVPFVAAWIMLRPSAVRIAAGTALFVAASYALGVTFTRGGYVGYAGALGVLAAAALLRWLPSGALGLRRMAVTALLAAGGTAILVPIVTGSFMGARIAGAKAEAATRSQHWSRAIAEIDAGVAPALFGMGLGTFPRTALFKDPDDASATFSFAREGGRGFLRLGSGRPLYVDQRVPVVAGRRYVLAFDARSSEPDARVDVHLCEKSIQYSFRCVRESVAVGHAGAGWEHHELALDSGAVGSGPSWLRRPVALSLSNSQRSTVVDVGNVRLAGEDGANIVVNGDFANGGAHWLFSADDHLPWHVFNLWVAILFEQGWLGIAAVGLAVAAVLARLGAATWRGDSFAAALLAAVVGFLLVGLTESLFDGPRVTTLFFLVVFAALLRPVAAPRAPAPGAARGAGAPREAAVSPVRR